MLSTFLITFIHFTAAFRRLDTLCGFVYDQEHLATYPLNKCITDYHPSNHFSSREYICSQGADGSVFIDVFNYWDSDDCSPGTKNAHSVRNVLDTDSNNAVYSCGPTNYDCFFEYTEHEIDPTIELPSYRTEFVIDGVCCDWHLAGFSGTPMTSEMPTTSAPTTPSPTTPSPTTPSPTTPSPTTPSPTTPSPTTPSPTTPSPTTPSPTTPSPTTPAPTTPTPTTSTTTSPDTTTTMVQMTTTAMMTSNTLDTTTGTPTSTPTFVLNPPDVSVIADSSEDSGSGSGSGSGSSDSSDGGLMVGTNSITFNVFEDDPNAASLTLISVEDPNRGGTSFTAAGIITYTVDSKTLKKCNKLEKKASSEEVIDFTVSIDYTAMLITNMQEAMGTVTMRVVCAGGAMINAIVDDKQMSQGHGIDSSQHVPKMVFSWGLELNIFLMVGILTLSVVCIIYAFTRRNRKRRERQRVGEEEDESDLDVENVDRIEMEMVKNERAKEQLIVVADETDDDEDEDEDGKDREEQEQQVENELQDDSEEELEQPEIAQFYLE